MREEFCDKCGRMTETGRLAHAERNRKNPIYGTDFSKLTSELVRDIRTSISQARDKIEDLEAGSLLWKDRLKPVEGLLTCGLITLFQVMEEIEKYEKKCLEEGCDPHT